MFVALTNACIALVHWRWGKCLVLALCRMLALALCHELALFTLAASSWWVCRHSRALPTRQLSCKSGCRHCDQVLVVTLLHQLAFIALVASPLLLPCRLLVLCHQVKCVALMLCRLLPCSCAVAALSLLLVIRRQCSCFAVTTTNSR